VVADGRRPLTDGGEEPPERPRLETWLFLFALAVYVATRLIGLTRFPIFFFTDEAIQGNLAGQLLENGFRDHTGTFLPPYFLNDQRWAVSLSVYIHLIPVWIFGKSVLAVRATSVAITILGVAATALLLRTGPRHRFWWTAPLIYAVMPLFFLHARTGFEAVMMASFYACFLCAYVLYRYRSPWYVLLALLFGAATFYAYTAGQGLMLVTGFALLLSDLRYHFRQKPKVIAAAALLAVLLAAPYVRYRRLHPGVVTDQLKVLNSYWIQPMPLSKKLDRFAGTYLAGFDPGYWFRPNEKEYVRHRMKGMPYFPYAFAPLLVLGVGVCLFHFRRSSAHRMILFSPLGVPFAGAAAEIQILRLMAIVVPVALFVAVGVEQLYRWMRRWVPYAPAAIGCAAVFTAGAARLTQVTLAEGPTWYPDYGLYGMQYGAPQVFAAVREELARSPERQILLSHTWANNPNEFLSFFLTPAERKRVTFTDIRGHVIWKRPIGEHDLFVVTAPELQEARRSAKLIFSAPERVIPYPDGRPGFLFVRARYVDDIDAIFAAEKVARARLTEGTAVLAGEMVSVRHSTLDMGAVSSLFDGREDTLIRGLEANPFVLELDFPKPKPLRRISADLGRMDNVAVAAEITSRGGARVRYEATYRWSAQTPRFELALPARAVTEKLRLEIRDLNSPEVTHIHVFELVLE
jgi:hypothetical protein